MIIVDKKINELTPFVKNSRKHTELQIDQVVKSIKEFGFTNPILIDENNTIIAGHCRILALKKLDAMTAPCIVLSGLSNNQKKAYIIADNKLALNASWDFEILLNQIQELKENDYDFELTGFTTDEIDTLTPQILSVGLTDDDAIPESIENPIVNYGDIWILGQHRLMCGNSTMIDHVEKLMSGEKADMVFTDPPYGIDYQDVKHKHNKIENDSNLDGIQSLISILLLQDCPMFICCNWKCYSVFERAMVEAGKPPKACIVWDKESRVQNLDKFGKQHEFILYHGEFGGEKTVDVDVWQCKRQVLSEHPTAKPVELIERAIQHFKKANVLDLFGGSGSTLIACEKTNKKCYMMEISPKYCDIIIKRWEQFTGKEAILWQM